MKDAAQSINITGTNVDLGSWSSITVCDNISFDTNTGIITNSNNLLGTTNYYNSLGSINVNDTIANCKLTVNNDCSLKIIEPQTTEYPKIELRNGSTLTILDKNFSPVLITLEKNAKVNFIYENKEFTFTNHYQDKMVFKDIKILAEMASLPHKEFAKVLSNDYTLEEIHDIANKYKAIDKETLNLFIGQNYKLFDNSYLDSHKEFFKDPTLFLNFKLVEKSLENSLLPYLPPEIKYHIASYLQEDIDDVDLIG